MLAENVDLLFGKCKSGRYRPSSYRELLNSIHRRHSAAVASYRLRKTAKSKRSAEKEILPFFLPASQSSFGSYEFRRVSRPRSLLTDADQRHGISNVILGRHANFNASTTSMHMALTASSINSLSLLS
ncbi:hypothetical protein MRB53_037246 [Persea americana]|nr:hypothetical protein MRB53_037246 [Persea americana]